MLIKLVCFFPYNSSTCTTFYMVACTFFYWERPENDAQLRCLGPLSTQNDLYLRTNFESQNDLYLRTERVVQMKIHKTGKLVTYATLESSMKHRCYQTLGYDLWQVIGRTISVNPLRCLISQLNTFFNTQQQLLNTVEQFMKQLFNGFGKMYRNNFYKYFNII